MSASRETSVRCERPLGQRNSGWIAPLVMLLVGTSSLTAGTGAVFERPPPGTPTRSGLRMTMNTIWVNSLGYRPVQVEFANVPSGARSADRSLTVVIETYYSRGRNGDRFTHYVDLPAGSPSVAATLSLPQQRQCQSFGVKVYEDGVLLDDLSFSSSATAQPNLNVRGRVATWSESAPAVLVIDSDAPTRAERFEMLHGRNPVVWSRIPNTYELPNVGTLAGVTDRNVGYYYPGSSTDEEVLTLVDNAPRLELLPPSDLPSRWIDYTCLDVIIVSLSDLLNIEANQPEVFEALRAWVASGPTLCVYGMGNEYERLAELQTRLQLEPPAHSGQDNDARGWRLPNPAVSRSGISLDQDFRDAMGNMYEGPPTIIVGNEGVIERVPVVSRIEGGTPFQWRTAGLGTVVAIAAEDPFAPKDQEWAWILNSITSPSWSWPQRHGISPARGNSEYWNFLIPGVGLPPVTAFCVFITLFAVVIGPVNYFVLKHKRRLYLLLVTVPGGAALVTFGLLAYALLSDGLGVRVRVRSFTEIDQRYGHAVSWSRQSYYAGLVPSRGIAFADNAAVYAIDPAGYDVYYYDGKEPPPKQHVWENSQQRLARGFLRSRVTSQFLVVRSRKTNAGLDITENADGSPPKIVNHLKSRIEKVFLVDADGNLFAAQNIALGATFEPEPADISSALDEIEALVAASAPKYPTGHESGSYFTGRSPDGRYRMYIEDYDGFAVGASLGSNVLETNIRRAFRDPRDGGLLTPRTFVAIVDSSPEVPLGATVRREDASFHIVFGKW